MTPNPKGITLFSCRGWHGERCWRLWNEANPDEALAFTTTAYSASFDNQPTRFFVAPGNDVLYISNYRENDMPLTRYIYDLHNNLTAVTDAAGHSTSLTYDLLGRKTSMTDPDMGLWQYGYDHLGNLTSQKDALGQQLCFFYDSANRLTSKQEDGDYDCATSNTLLASYSYYSNGPGRGQPQTITTSQPGYSLNDSFTYDYRGRLTSQSRTLNGRTYTMASQYDSLDRPTSLTYPNGESATIGYNGQFPDTLTANGQTLVSNQTYNHRGQLAQLNRGNNANTSYSYFGSENNYRLSTIQHGGANDTRSDYLYTYDPLGNITTLTERIKEGSLTLNQAQNFSYDSLNRLTDAYAIANGSLPGYDLGYSYDPAGNITSRTTNNSQTTTYSYSPTQPHAATALTGSTTASYSYDDNGNMTGRTEGGLTYTQHFDIENRLTQVTVNNATTYFYYDANGQRTLTVEPNGTATYTPFPGYEESVISTATESPTIIQRVTFALSQPIAIHVSGDPLATNNGYFYFHTDQLGSTSYLTKSTGSKLTGSDARYQPYGSYRTAPSQTITDTGYTGQKENRELGLIYYNARYYDPALARFISPDTLIPNPAHPQTLNRYAYTLNNPTRLTDPTGHISCDSVHLPEDDQIACAITPKPTISLKLMVDFKNFDPADTYQTQIMAAIQEAALLVGQTLANALNQMYPNWHLTAAEAFLLVYGGTVTFIWKGAVDGVTWAGWTETANEIWLYDTKDAIINGEKVGRVTHKVPWIIHELGHAFYKATGGTTVTDATQAFFDDNPDVGRQVDGNYTGYAGDKINGSLYWQQSHDMAASEQFADMFIGWIYGQWQTDFDGNWSDEGLAMSNFMNGNIPTWLNLKVQQ